MSYPETMHDSRGCECRSCFRCQPRGGCSHHGQCEMLFVAGSKSEYSWFCLDCAFEALESEAFEPAVKDDAENDDIFGDSQQAEIDELFDRCRAANDRIDRLCQLISELQSAVHSH